MKVALIVIYNHQYNSNIERIEELYKEKFKHIFHLVPFYQGNKKNVIPVYENSLYFQGYVAQGLKQYYNEEFEHYFFIGDDLILNPEINQSNYKKHLKLNNKTSFIPNLLLLHKLDFWGNIILAYNYKINIHAVEAQMRLPSYSEAKLKFDNFNLELKNLSFENLYRKPKQELKFRSLKINFEYYLRKYKDKLFRKVYSLPYPLVGSYSDIFVVSASSIKDFCHYSGVFSATNLHVEIAIPTALVLSSKEIVTENDLILQGRALWTKEDLKFLDKYNFDLNQLLTDFPKNHLYIHPVKLSKWKTN